MFDISFRIAAQSRFFCKVHSLVLYQEMHYPLPEADTFDRIPIFRYSDSYWTTNRLSANRDDYNQAINCREVSNRRVYDWKTTVATAMAMTFARKPVEVGGQPAVAGTSKKPGSTASTRTTGMPTEILATARMLFFELLVLQAPSLWLVDIPVDIAVCPFLMSDVHVIYYRTDLLGCHQTIGISNIGP
jgi:hypothetical protein